MDNVSTTNKLITPEELASLLRMSKPSVYRLIEKRKIPFYKISGSLRFKLSEIERYINDARIDSIV
jgi:excisionase family DNA binding protein